jgi:hypothetical protein
MKIEKIAKIGVKKAEGYLYFVDGEGDVSRAKIKTNLNKKGKQR